MRVTARDKAGVDYLLDAGGLLKANFTTDKAHRRQPYSGSYRLVLRWAKRLLWAVAFTLADRSLTPA